VTRVALSLGSNLGDRLENLRRAVQSIRATAGVSALVASSVYETDPVGGPEQPSFLNAVVRAESSLTPAEILSLAQRCEIGAARVREVRWGPRTLDVDVLAVGDVRSDDISLTLPHPRALERAFVLVPWCEVDPEFLVDGRTVAEWCAGVETEGVRRTGDLLVAGA
jgi:2-amino-4-hydroxy-6-hydroxymethyldihydropteridine diphosphokinase